MLSGTITNRVPGWLPKLAATTVVCWVLGTNTYFDSTNISSSIHWNADNSSDVAIPVDTGPVHVLSSDDTGLYKIIFAAQEKSEWNTADSALARLTDKSLLGHVYADRYHRRPADLAELQSWLRHYADLPEATEIYSRALILAGKEEGIPLPVNGTAWSGSDVYGTSVGFRTPATDNKSPMAAVRFSSKLNKLIHTGDSIAAEALLESERHYRPVPLHEAAHAEGLIAASFFYKGNIAHARRIANSGAKQQNPLALWINGLAAWKQGDMHTAGDSFALLSAQSNLSAWDRSTAQFWAWRALKRAGDSSNAHFWLQQAAQQPHSFYGLMAAHLLGSDKSWSWDVPIFNSQHVAALAAQKAGTRALALLQVGQHGLAESELRHVNVQGHRDLQEAMLALASAEHMPSLVLQLGGVATKADGSLYDAALYPLPPWQPVDGFKVDPALMYALMRHESQFDPTAVSDRGACGLMQLLPATAKLMSPHSEAAASDCSGRLLDPTVNMGLGQRYVSYLGSQPMVGDNLLLLLAAYNGGPGKLAHGLHDDRESQVHGLSSHRDYEKGDPLLFLESIPVRQTHDYVQQVLVHYWGYRARLGETEISLTQLSHGEWPHTAPPAVHPVVPTGTREAQADGILVASNSESR